MGALLGTVCHPSQADAVDAYFSEQGPSFTAGATSYQSWFEKVSGTWQLKQQSITGAGVVTNLTSVNATVPTFPDCDELAPFNDGLTVGWLLATLMVAAWGFSMIRRQAR